MRMSDQLSDLNSKVDQIVVLNEELQQDVFEVQKRLLDLQEDYSLNEQCSMDLQSDSASSIYSDIGGIDEDQISMSPVRVSEMEKSAMQSNASRPSTMKILLDRFTS